MPTVFATVGRMPGVDLDPDAPSLFRFGSQNRNEPAPTRVAYASREPRLGPRIVGQILAGFVWIRHGFGSSQHVGNLEVFNHQQVITPDESAACLWWKSLRWLAILRCLAATVSRLRSRFFDRCLARCNRCWAAANRAAAARPQRGLSMCCPSLVVANLQMPSSMPAWRPLAGDVAAHGRRRYIPDRSSETRRRPPYFRVTRPAFRHATQLTKRH